MKNYLRSNITDIELLRLENRNPLIDIFELIGFYIEYSNSLETLEISITELEQANKSFNNELKNHFYQFYNNNKGNKRKYINTAEKYIRDTLKTQNKRVSRPLLRKLYETKSNSCIIMSIYITDVVELIFDYIKKEPILWQIFNKEILNNCIILKKDLRYVYPQDCLQNILRFQYSFILKYYHKFYSPAKKEILNNTRKALSNNKHINEIHKSCVKKKDSRVEYNNNLEII